MSGALVQGGQLFCCVSIHGMSAKFSAFIGFLTELATFQMPGFPPDGASRKWSYVSWSVQELKDLISVSLVESNWIAQSSHPRWERRQNGEKDGRRLQVRSKNLMVHVRYMSSPPSLILNDIRSCLQPKRTVIPNSLYKSGPLVFINNTQAKLYKECFQPLFNKIRDHKCATHSKILCRLSLL